MGSYQEKLRQFNSTPKYLGEMEFMRNKMNIQKKEKVLDVGCGTGYMCEYLRKQTSGDLYGYDKDFKLLDVKDSFYYRGEFHFKFDKMYFMHSFAHIPTITQLLNYWREHVKDIYILTPNKSWLECQTNETYKPDKTVYKHYTIADLEVLLELTDFNLIQSEGYGPECRDFKERIFIHAS